MIHITPKVPEWISDLTDEQLIDMLEDVDYCQATDSYDAPSIQSLMAIVAKYGYSDSVQLPMRVFFASIDIWHEAAHRFYMKTTENW
jgi:hypothetical protein